MKRIICIGILSMAASGCGGLLSPPTKEEIQERRNALADAKLKLEAAELAKTSNVEVLRAEFQVAEAEFQVAQAKGVRESVTAGAHYTEVGARLLEGPLGAAFPGIGAALSGIAMAAGLVRKVMAHNDEEPPPPAGKTA